MADKIVFGAGCTWWDSIGKSGEFPLSGGRGLPVCPHCGSPLLEGGTEAQWTSSLDAHAARGNAGYRAMIEWSRGQCFKGYEALKAAYAARQIDGKDQIQ